VDGPPPERIEVQGVALKLDGPAGFTVVQLDDTSRNVLIVRGGQGAPGKPSHCTLYTTGRILSQDHTSVHVGLYLYSTVRNPGFGQGCTLIGYGPAVIRLDLGVPLGQRVVYNGTDNTTPVRVVDPRALLQATTLPDGYQRPGTLVEETIGTGADSTIREQRTYLGPQANDDIEIYEGTPNAVEPSGNQDVLARVTVRGHPATFEQARGFADLRCLRWRERVDDAVEVCSRGATTAPLTARDLQQVADGLRRLTEA